MLFEVSDNVFIIGYPIKINVKNLPIWKAGTIASEPSLNIGDLPAFYVDTGTKEGMSGSPVIIYSVNQPYKTIKGYVCMNNKTKFKFLGIYSGRDTCYNENEARLGLVWKKEKIDQMIKNNLKNGD